VLIPTPVWLKWLSKYSVPEGIKPQVSGCLVFGLVTVLTDRCHTATKER